MGGDPVAYGTIFASSDGKMVMQNLNGRLASYIDKVRLLEVENAALESSISDFYAKEGLAGEPKDYDHYYHQIQELNDQIICTTAENNQILLKIDNYCMNLEDVRQKFETECSIHENVEADLKTLYPIFDELSNCKADLETKLETLQGELRALKTTREEKLICLKKRAGDASMEAGTCPGPDLRKSLEEMRRKYEAMIDANRKESAQWFEGELEEASQEFCSQEAEDGDRKVTDLKCRLRAFKIDLQAQCSLRDTLQVSLAEVERRFHAQLAKIQDQVACTEQQLAELRLETEGQDAEYKELLDVKNRLEQEIQTYRGLLEGGQPDNGCGKADYFHPGLEVNTAQMNLVEEDKEAQPGGGSVPVGKPQP
ncbi:keratin, type I cytoskeletal 19-like [Varanus komodoensis]|uniref:keratin, type I cytoskeletal 19-like n=1 Tax=Varanus komodoensis TaxID=61221 RepID=UPI001CF79478|nr:keratin, type I cytoskeletal 19-like [Varanus komodoensis]